MSQSFERKADRPMWRPAALVVVAFFTSGVLPAWFRLREHEVTREIREVLDPARVLTSTVRSALERSIATHAGYLLSGNPILLARGREWEAQREQASGRLAALGPAMGPQARMALAELRERLGRVARIRAAHEAAHPTREDEFRDLPGIDAEVEGLLGASDRFEEALAREKDERLRNLAALAQADWIANVALSVLGIAAILSVTRLTRREQRSRAAAEAAVRMRDDVVSIVSHDLRNPLNIVSMAAEYLLDSLPAGGAWSRERKQVEMISRAGRSMNAMIEDLLDIARIETGVLAVERVAVPVAPLMDEAATMLRPIAEKNHQRLECTVAEGLPPICADRDRVIQVLSNLVGNAVKFTPAGGTIAVAAEAQKSAVLFRVSNTGTGISAAQIPHLFDRFWQARRADRRGLGLGLPIVKALVEAHGGRVTVESDEARGTTFTFSIGSWCDPGPAEVVLDHAGEVVLDHTMDSII
jgi:signal transduction histidine kinase